MKHFTDEELAAEYWRASWAELVTQMHVAELSDEQLSRLRTIKRFLALPHEPAL